MGKFDRVELLLGSQGLQKLKKANVLLFGVGGVGGFTAEALVRSGVGSITLVDNDVVNETNINRQIIATVQSVGLSKVEVMKARLNAINPEVKVDTLNLFYLPENADTIDFSAFDYVVDAVDTVSAKIAVIERAKEQGVPVISCMGTGGKLNPELLTVGDIANTKGCPLARVMRRELKKRNITGVKVVYSTEESAQVSLDNPLSEEKGKGRVAPPSMIFVPAIAGLMMANQVVLDLVKGK